MNIKKIIGIVIVGSLCLLNVSFAATNNTFSAVGDSITYAGGFALEDRWTNIVATNIGASELNEGVSGSCLSDYGACSTKSPLVNRMDSDIYPYTPKYIYLQPHVNDINNDNLVPVSEYENHLIELYDDIELNNPEAIVLTGSHVTYPLSSFWSMNEVMKASAKNREQAIKRQIPFVEIGYTLDFQSSYIASTCHPNVLGMSVMATKITTAINNQASHTMNVNNFNIYHTCSDTLEILNYSIDMSNYNCNTNTGSIDWIVLKDISLGKIEVERADEDFILTIAERYGVSQAVNISYSNGTNTNVNTNVGGDLILNVEAVNDLTITFVDYYVEPQTNAVNNLIHINAQTNTINQTISTNTHYFSSSSKVLNFLSIVWGEL